MGVIRILLVEDDEDDYTLTRELLAEVEDEQFDLVWAPTYEDAILEIRRGGYDVYLVDYRLGRRSGLDLLCGELQEGRLGPVIILTGQDAREVDVEAMKHGAAGYLVKSELRSRHLARTLRYAIEGYAAKNTEPASGIATAAASKRGRTVALIGSKGGAGTTTIVANVASALCTRGLSVTAVEMRGDYGNLTRLVNIAPLHDINTLLALEPHQIGPEQFEACLSRQLSGLRVLAAPQNPEDYRPLRVDHVRAITDAAIRTSDLVIMDLPSAATDVNREVLCKADLVAMVIEREPSAIASARAMMALFQTWGVRVPIGSVIISRINIPEATSAAEINSQLGLKKYGVIPAAPEIFHKCAVTLQPVIHAHPAHPVGRAMDELALFLLLVR
ncbi:MAG TPA: response regulator [Candidatus Limnocylindrales bacterium]|nr:response regulator [Candidatus Limnocylindrales bacterium]